MRVLVLTHNYPRFRGDPAGAFVARLGRSAADAGTEIRILAPHAARTPRHAVEQGIPVTRFRYAPAALERVGYSGDVGGSIWRMPLTVSMLPLYLAAFRQAARRTVTEFAPDVIHAHWWFPAGWIAAGLGRPYVVTCHGSDVRLLDRSRLARRIAGPVMRRAGGITTVSQFLARDLVRLLGTETRAPQPIPMPLDVEHFSRGLAVPKATPARILYAGNLVRAKGVDVLLRACAELHAQRVLFGLKLLGEGPEEMSLRHLARDLGLAASVAWSPFVPQDAMPAEYGASTVTVLPSRGQAEGLGLALVEALLAGCAVIGSPAGGIPEVIAHEETGLLFRDGDASDLAAALARMLTDAPLRARLTALGRARMVERHSPQAAAHRFRELYHHARDRGQPSVAAVR